MRTRPGIAMGIGASLLALVINSVAAPDSQKTVSPVPHSAAVPDWQQTLSPLSRGEFPNPRPLIATYHFGWSGLIAATAEIRFASLEDKLQTEGAGQTVGIVRGLWKFDIHHLATANPATLQPLTMHQVEEFRSRKLTTDLTFHPGWVDRFRDDTKTKKPPTHKTFGFPGELLDLHSALLTVRSQPLKDGDEYRFVVYPASNAYLATLRVTGRTSLATPAGTYPAIKLDLQLKKVGKHGELEPHKKFRRASVWVSDDNDRLLLRIEAGVFVGTIFAELQSVRFPSAKE